MGYSHFVLKLMKSRLERSSQRWFCHLCSFFSVRSSGCLLFAVLDPDEQEVVVEVPRVVQNPPKPVMTTRPTAVKATGIVVFFWFFLIHCLQYLSLGSNCVCIWCFDECFSKFILPLNGNLTSL